MGRIFLTSDTHYDHVNICRGTSKWAEGEGDQKVRDFDSLQEMNDTIVNNINSVVGPEDTLEHFGDWSFNGKENIKIFRDRINCKNVNLIFGNHDQWIEPINSPYRKLFGSVDYYKKIQYGRGKYSFICCFHFAQRVWESSHRGSLHAYGHSHGTIPDYFRSKDVGMDANGMKVIPLDELVKELLSRPIGFVDHHGPNTN